MRLVVTDTPKAVELVKYKSEKYYRLVDLGYRTNWTIDSGLGHTWLNMSVPEEKESESTTASVECNRRSSVTERP